MIGVTNVLFFARSMNASELKLAAFARRAGWRVIYDQYLGVEETRSRKNEFAFLRDQIAPIVHAVTFRSRSSRDDFVANGIQAENCLVLPEPALTGSDELAAIEWSSRHVRRYGTYAFLPAMRGWKRQSGSRTAPDWPKKSHKHLVWLADSGLRGGKLELAGIARILPVIEWIAKVRKLELVLVSNDMEHCRRLAAEADVTVRTVPWTLENCIHATRNADVCVQPAPVLPAAPRNDSVVLRPLAENIPVVTDYSLPRQIGELVKTAGTEDEWHAAIVAALDRKNSGNPTQSTKRKIADILGIEATAGHWFDVLLRESAEIAGD